LEGSVLPKRKLINPKPGDQRYIRRDEQGHFTGEQADVGRSPSQEDRRRKAEHEAPKGKGDRGDRKPAD
jgi:hypothetical protein